MRDLGSRAVHTHTHFSLPLDVDSRGAAPRELNREVEK